MKRLILLRHAKSSWDNPDLADFDRPLNKRGKSDAPKVGQRLAKRGFMPDVIISSPAKRALKTAKIISKAIGYPVKEIQTDKRIYDASLSDLLDVIHEIEDVFRTVMLVGHNPGFNSLSYYLTEYTVENIPTCGRFEVEFDITSWKKVGERTGRFVAFDYPKKFK